jgi:hypothetical protein
MAQALYQIANFLSDSAKHFSLALSAGLLVYCATQTISGVLCEIMASRGMPQRSIIRVAIGMALIQLLLAVSVALLSHYALDFFSMWYTKPLGPALTIR